MAEVPDNVRPLFLAAGWYPGRHVGVRFDRVEGLRSFPAAAPLLVSFGGLRVGASGPGRDCAASDIEFTLKPSAGARYAVGKLESPGDDLFPLGMAGNRHLDLFLDARGRLWAYCVPNGRLDNIGDSFEVGVVRLLLGHKWPEKGTPNHLLQM